MYKNDILQHLNENGEILQQIQNEKQLNDVSEIIYIKLQQIQMNTQNHLVITNIISNLIMKMILLEIQINDTLHCLLQHLNQQNLLSGIQKQLLKEKFNFQTEKEEINSNLNIKVNLDQLLFGKSNILKTHIFGKAILDFSGNFLWADQKTQKLFEKKQQILQNSNFFELLIPFSRNHLSQQMFQENSYPGSQIKIAFVIYSDKNFQKYQKLIKKKKFNKKQYQEYSKVSNLKNGVFFKYLKSLSARATIINIKFKQKEVFKIRHDKNFNFKFPEKHQYLCLQSVQDKLSIEEKQSEIYQPVIYLEIRGSKNIPKFDYELMQKDKIIQKLENQILSKLIKQLINE